MQNGLAPSSAAQWDAAIATTFAAIIALSIALFGEWMRARFFRPTLGLSLVNPRGELTGETLSTGATQQARYWD